MSITATFAYPPGGALYALLSNNALIPGGLGGTPSGEWWNGSGYEAWNDSHYASYVVALVQQGTSKNYLLTLPAGASQTTEHSVTVYANASPVLGDSPIGQGVINDTVGVDSPSDTIILSRLPSTAALERDLQNLCDCLVTGTLSPNATGRYVPLSGGWNGFPAMIRADGAYVISQASSAGSLNPNYSLFASNTTLGNETNLFGYSPTDGVTAIITGTYAPLGGSTGIATVKLIAHSAAAIGDAMSLTSGAITALQTGLATLANQTSQGVVALATASALASVLSAVNAITTNTARSAPRVPQWLVRPASGTSVYRVYLYLYNLQGQLEDADANTVTAHASSAAGGGDLNGNLSSTTMVRESVGVYHVDYTVHSTDIVGEVICDFAWLIASVAMKDAGTGTVADADSIATLNTVNTNVATLISRITQAILFDGSGFVRAKTETNSDKTGYALTSAYDAAKTAATQASVNEIDTDSDEILTAIGSIPTAPTVAQVRQEMDNNSTKLASINTNVAQLIADEAAESGVIPGGHDFTLVVRDNSSNPIPQCGVWIASSSSGTPVVVQTVFTDNNGHLQLSLLPGTYYGWRFKAGYGEFTDPFTFIVV